MDTLSYEGWQQARRSLADLIGITRRESGQKPTIFGCDVIQSVPNKSNFIQSCMTCKY